MNLDTDLIPFTNFNSKWIIDLNVKCKTIKPLDLEEKSGWYTSSTPKAQSMKEIIDNLDFINILKLLLCKRHYQENGKTSNIHWKKIFAKDKGL